MSLKTAVMEFLNSYTEESETQEEEVKTDTTSTTEVTDTDESTETPAVVTTVTQDRPKRQAVVQVAAQPVSLSIDDLGSMPPEEINKRWDEIQTVLSSQTRG